MTTWKVEGVESQLDGFHLGPVDLELGPGRAVAALGSSGAGKTTLLRTLAGFLPARSGRIVRDGVDITDWMPEERGLGYVPQGLGLFAHRTVERNVRFPLEVRGRRDARARTQELLERFHLTPLQHRYPARLSGGELQRVAIARALAAEPELIVWDEPWQALDVEARYELGQVLQELRETDRVPVLVVTHDPGLAFSLADRFLVLRRGRVAWQGDAGALLDHPFDGFSARFVGLENVFDRPELEARQATPFIAWLLERAGEEGVAFGRPLVAGPPGRGAGVGRGGPLCPADARGPRGDSRCRRALGRRAARSSLALPTPVRGHDAPVRRGRDNPSSSRRRGARDRGGRMTRRANVVSDQDLSLLRSLDQSRSVVAASAHVGISRDRAIYRLQRLRDAVGGPVVTSERGGSGHGGTRLTDLGHRVARGGFNSVELVAARASAGLSAPNRLAGVYRHVPTPAIRARAPSPPSGGVRRRRGRAGRAPPRPGGDPRRARAVRDQRAERAPGTVESIRPAGRLGRTLVVRVGPVRVRAAVTPEPIRQLGLAPGTSVYVYVKATALRRAPGGRGRPYSRIPSVVSEKTASPSGRFGESMRRAMRRGGFDFRK